MKIKQLVQITQVLERFVNKKLSIKLSYKIMKFLKATEADITFYKEKLTKIIEEYGERAEDGSIKMIDNNFKIKENEIENFNKAYFELEEIEIELPNIKFNLNELEEIKISPAELYILDNLIEE